MGRPAYKPTEDESERVEFLTAIGTRRGDIARVLKISEPTLLKYYKTELEEGDQNTTEKVARTLFSIATDRDHPKAAVSAMFWMKTRACWRETAEVHHTVNIAEIYEKETARWLTPDAAVSGRN